MSLDQRPIVVKDGPTTLHQFNVFKEFRRLSDYDGLVQYLITNYPKNVKNRTFNFNNSGHTFHMLYAYVPSPSNKERKQIRLDCIEKLLKTTTNDFRLYEDLMSLIDITDTHKCPCELIASRMNDNIVFNESLKNKNFDTKPCKLKKEPIDAILFKYSINWRTNLNKKRTSNKVGNKGKDSAPVVDNDVIIPNPYMSQTTLVGLCGATVSLCDHVFSFEERQLRSGDETVSFVKSCILCGQKMGVQ
ncbi:lef-5 [Clostera anachoreta granulovirus]|uniref:Lef-5 n=1 Tax=Clostera anachoreta granulovirus TaxID=283675 RepID=F4ZKU9_9BBAC|nr:lef-5 [Clostera anachoreta granulovirus]AEB00360.1 lef-5 [Clostera anachoreta granulovirus]